MIDKKKAYEERVESQLKAWSAEIDRMKAELQCAAADAKIKAQDKLDELTHKRDSAQRKLEELKLRSADAWEEITDDVERAWGDLKDAIKGARDALKKGA